MKKILIISDNKYLVENFKSLIVSKKITNVEVEYFYSSINKNPAELIELGMQSINVKCLDTINNIISKYDIVMSLHCKTIFPEKLVNGTLCINVHPGLNPYNRGWYPQVFSILNKKPIGATIHIMDDDIDSGNVICQKELAIDDIDTSLDVYNKVLDLEIELLKENLECILREKFNSVKIKEVGNYNSIQDFKALCELDLNQKGTLKEHIDLLRALSHGEFKNGYFFDSKGDKVFVKLSLFS